MKLSFKTIEGHRIDAVSNTFQLVDRGDGASVKAKGMEARYHLMVGDDGWCYVLDRKEYEGVRRAMNSPASTE